MKIYIEDEKISDKLIENKISALAENLQENNLTNGKLIICKAANPLGTYIQWMACEKVNIIPLFAPYDFPIENSSILNYLPFESIIYTSSMLESSLKQLQVSNSALFDSNIPIGSVIHMSSATTGNPKLILRTKQQMDNELLRYCTRLALSEQDVILPMVPFYHSFGFISVMLAGIKVNDTIVLPNIILPRNILHLCNQYGVTILYGVPYLFDKMLKLNNSYNFNKNIRYIISTGERMIEGLQAKFYKKFNIWPIQQYGSSETGSLALSEFGDEYNIIGLPLSGVEFYIDSEGSSKNNILVSTKDTIGSYVVNGNLLNLDNERFKIGDIGEIRADRKLIIYGRSDDIIIKGGEKISITAVTKVIKLLPEIDEVLIYQSNNALQEVICNYSSNQVISNDKLINHCKQYLSNYQIPSQFIRVEKIENCRHHSWKKND
ncbi:ANL family adenylate-forming protein [Anaerocolumna jejuensis]|uniref:ANL family adenylate-forming protein n=1 Tax=Anaerocolumna jejuensis TaxID=259063 RepID=UPI003F7B981D